MPKLGTESHKLLKSWPVQTLQVTVVGGPSAGASFVAQSERVTVGSAPGNDLVLSDPTVSGYHLQLERVDVGIRVIDLGSTNGTHLEATRLERGTVAAGAVLSLGRSQLRVGEGDTALVALHDADAFGALRGRTPVMRRLMARIDRIASSDAAVLLIGESGTGKELAARELHQRSPRALRPFVTVDCGALVPTLAASELFGHERGAFTGADRQRPGAFERAKGGTLLLDEVGELPAELQAHLLGVLERRTFRRVGGQHELQVDVRVVSATNRDFRAEVNAGTFRLDLYYRLAIVCLELPALRERVHDVPILASHFLAELGHEGRLDQVLPQPTLQRLMAHRWPGNVRELRNVIEASVATGELPTLRSTPPPSGMPTRTSAPPRGAGATLPIEPLLSLPYREARDQLVGHFQAEYLRRLLDRTKGNVSGAAREAKMDRSHLIDLLRRHKLR